MSEKVIVAVDAMGGDKAPFETIKGAMKALEEIESLHLVLVGKKEIIEEPVISKKFNRDEVTDDQFFDDFFNDED